MITYEMFGSVAEADLTSDDSSEAQRVSVSVDSFCTGDENCVLVNANDDGWWNVYFSREPSMDEIKTALAEMNHVAPSEIGIVPRTVRAG